MSEQHLVLRVASPQDSAAWQKLGRKHAPQEGSYIAWLGDRPIARVTLRQHDNVIELRDFALASRQLAAHGAAALQQIITFCRERGNIITVEYPQRYCALFLAAYFKQNTRTHMIMALADYQPQPLRLPVGITLRHPDLSDEQAITAMAYRNYQGTLDGDMVSSSRAQTTAMVRPIFVNEYAQLDTDCSFIAEDAHGELVGSNLLGDESKSAAERLAWVLDISIAPEWRGKGLGRALFASGLDAAKAKGYHRLGLMVTIGNHRAQALYRTFGLKEYGPLMYEAILHL
jgi:ribosomal protein S18 acetylase RimI-like enzyme